MKRTGFLKACSKLMAFVLTAGITVGAFAQLFRKSQRVRYLCLHI